MFRSNAMPARVTLVATGWRCRAACFIRPCPVILLATGLPETQVGRSYFRSLKISLRTSSYAGSACSLVLIWHLLCISPFLMDIWSRARIFTPGFTGAACFPNSLWFPVLGKKYTCSVKFCSTHEHNIYHLESNAM